MQEIPLFPLGTVLFPGGLLPLRIFEPRYVDMVGRCMRADEVFGVVLIREGREIDSEVTTASVGTSARIVDFQTLSSGLLGLLCRGEQRFAIRTQRRQEDGLNCANVEWLPDAPFTPMGAQYAALVEILREVMARLEHVGRFVEPRYEDACWVSHRLAEFLPLEPAAQQQLLEMDDPTARLKLLAPLMRTRARSD